MQTLLRLQCLKCLLRGGRWPLKPLLPPERLLLVGGYGRLLLPLESLIEFLCFRLLTSLDLAHHPLNQVDLLVLLEDAHPLDNMLGSPLDTAGPTLLLGRVFNCFVGLFRVG